MKKYSLLIGSEIEDCDVIKDEEGEYYEVKDVDIFLKELRDKLENTHLNRIEHEINKTINKFFGK